MAKRKSETMAVGFCLDESGSMGAIHAATISGFNEYVDDLRKQGDTVLSLTLFSERAGETYRPLCEAEPIGTVPQLTVGNYRPGGNTPLFDAIGHTIGKLDAALSARKTKPGSVLFVIQTDGHENASREFSRKDVVDLIARKEADGWRFIYLGADQDDLEAEHAAVAMGISPGSSFSYDYASTGQTYAAVASASASLRADPTMTSRQVASAVRAGAQAKPKAKPKRDTSTPNF